MRLAPVLVHPATLDRMPLFQLVDWADRYGRVLTSVRAVSGRDVLVLEPYRAKAATPIARAPQHRTAPPAGPDGGPRTA
jgi:hypothetical protein